MRFFKKRKKAILCILLLVFAIVIYCVWSGLSDDTPNVREEYVWNSTLQPEYIEFEGVKYIENSKVETVLICGVDNYGKITHSNSNGTGGQADLLMLLVINNQEKVIDIVHINRDTMTSINILNDNYYTAGSATAQIALSHAYGNGNSASSKNTVAAVENLLYGIDVDKYMFVNMGAIPVINDHFGGVEVLIEDDFSAVDSSLEQGSTIRLDGNQAYNFLRARKELGDSSNETRMRRHRRYVDSLLEVVYEGRADSEKLAFELYNKIYDYMNTSLSASEITALVLKTADYTRNDFIVPEGSFNYETNLVEFYPYDDELRKLVVDLFYVPFEDE